VPPLYVHALTGERVRSWRSGERRVESVPIGPVFAVCERRATVPPLTEEELRHQYAIVTRIATHAAAVLPARFGSLIEEEELARIIARREAVIVDAIALVRNRIQMTVRASAEAPPEPAIAIASSGREYLERRQREVSPLLSPNVEAALRKVAAHVVREVREVTRARSVAVHHLVEASDVYAYRDELQGIGGLTVSGPAPPYAFVPELWS
jgi:hypothetical protein